ncbi:MAG: retroviral-like aspartic protease family protein [Patescibacteria group bacterium]
MSWQLGPKIFKYKIIDRTLYPVISTNLFFGKKKIKIDALVDSGATISVFKDEVAEQLGVVIEEGTETYLGGVGGRIKGYIHKIEVEIAGKKFVCTVVFSHEYTVSFNLLGREAFFQQFKIIFEEKKNLLTLG